MEGGAGGEKDTRRKDVKRKVEREMRGKRNRWIERDFESNFKKQTNFTRRYPSSLTPASLTRNN